MEKPCLELACPDYEEINQGILNYLIDHTEILKKDPRKDATLQIPYPNFVDTKDFIQHNSKLQKYFQSLGLMLFHVYYAVAWNPTQEDTINPFKDFGNPNLISSCPIHIDRPPVQWKMNWPVMNMIGSGTRFYRSRDQSKSVEDFVVRTGVAESLDRDIWHLPYEPFEEIHRHVFGTSPILMNGLIPHDVWFNLDLPMPRIGLQMMFFKEPRHLLDADCVILS
jgi:hypothetical protein